MEIVRAFKGRVMRISVLSTGVLAMVVSLLNNTGGKGVLLGGMTACAAFWVWLRSAERLAVDKRGGPYGMVLISMARLALYGVALVAACSLGPEKVWGVAGAAVGLGVPYAVTVWAAIVGARESTRK